MKRLSFSTQEELKEFTDMFQKEYKDFFNQELKRSKIEKFISKLAGKKNYNTLLGSLPSFKITEFSQFEHLLYTLGDHKTKLDLVKQYIPNNLIIEQFEYFDRETFNINKINFVSGLQIPDEDSLELIKKGLIKDIDKEFIDCFNLIIDFYKKLKLSKKQTFNFAIDFCTFAQEGLISDSVVELFEDSLDCEVEKTF